MITLQITNIELPTGYTHDATDWQVATSKTFSADSIVAESLNDSEQKTVKLFDLPLDPQIKHYSRARILFNRGYSKWAIIDEFYPKDINEISLDLDLPGALSVPVFAHDYNLNKFPTTKFTINLEGFSSTGTGKHVATNWLIEDMDGKVLLTVDNDDRNLVTRTFTELVLPFSQIIKISASFISSSNDVSDMSTMTVVTKGMYDIDPIIITDVGRIIPEHDKVVETTQIVGLTKIEWKLYDADDVLVWSMDTVGTKVVIPGQYFTDNTHGRITIKSFTITDHSEVISKDFKVVDVLPSTLPYNVSY